MVEMPDFQLMEAVDSDSMVWVSGRRGPSHRPVGHPIGSYRSKRAVWEDIEAEAKPHSPLVVVAVSVAERAVPSSGVAAASTWPTDFRIF